MDLDKIKQKLDSFQKKVKKEKVDNKKFFWTPPVGKSIIRIVPSKENPKYPFKEIPIHYGIRKFPMLSLENFGEKDPINEFISALRKTGNKEDWQLSRKMEPKVRTFVNVVVRGEEDKGVRLWGFGKEIYNELLRLASDEEIGDYTSITDGRDFTIETVGPEVTGTKYNKSSLRPKIKTSPLSDDVNQTKKFMSEQPDVITIYEKVEYNDMKKILEEYLKPSEEPGSDEEAMSEESASTTQNSKEFDDLFAKK